jgi:uncharacterized protein YodC (DUF2158 family)
MANTIQFQPGDVVRLKSGGPDMTIVHGDGGPMHEGQFLCIWFDGTRKLDDWFEAAVLGKKVTSAPRRVMRA